MSANPPKLLPETDYLLESNKAAMGTVLTAYRGGDPLNDPPALGYPNILEVEMARRIPLMAQRTRDLNENVFLNPESGWGEIKKFMDGVFDTYKKTNEAELIKKPKNEQEQLEQMQQMRPVRVDPNELANIRQLATKLDQNMKRFGTSFWTDPRTKGYAEWLNREAGIGTAGFMESGDQPAELGLIGRGAQTAWQGLEGMASPAMSMIHGMWDIGRRSIQAMGGPDIGPSYPTNFIEAEDGSLVHNGGKAPSMMDGIVMMWGAATNQNIEKFAAQAGRAQQWEQANRAGLAGLTTTVSRLGGEIVGMAPGFGAAAKLGEMTLGTLSMRGLQMLGTLRLAKGLQTSERGLKIIKAMSKGMGQATGMAAYESATQGRVEGYGASFLHGMMMAPVLMTLGALGKKTEWFAHNRANMPAAASRAVAGALEGAGFAAVETLAPQLLPSAWGFIRDPNESTWQTFAKNMLAFSMVKLGTGHTAIASPEELAIKRGIGRAQFAEKVARGEVAPEDVASSPVPNEAKLRELGEVSMRSREGKTEQERQQARERQRQLEQELDVEEFGKGPAEESVADYQSPERPEARMPTREELQAAREMPSGPEKRQRIIEMLRDANKAFGRESARFLENVSKAELERQVRDLEALKDLQSAGDVQQSMMRGVHVDKVLKARQQALEKLREENVPRGTPEPAELEARRGAQSPSGVRGGPQSLQQPPTRQVEATPGTPRTEARDIFSVWQGRPARGGLRVPGFEKRIGGFQGDPVQTAHRSGKIPGSKRNVLGVFKMFENLMRTQEGRDIVTGSHEFSHDMHRHMISKRGGRAFMKAAKVQLEEALKSDPRIGAEIETMLKDYPGAEKLSGTVRWMEAWAEWHARNLLGEVGLDAKLPAISAYMRNWLASPKQARLQWQYQTSQRLIHDYNAQGSRGRLAASIVSRAAPPTEVQKATKPTLFQKIKEGFEAAVFDDMAKLKASQNRWLKASGRRPEDVSIIEDPARLSDALAMTATKTAEYFTRVGIKLPGQEGHTVGLGPIMDSLRGKEREFEQYVVAVRSMELYNKGKSTQLPPQDYTESIKSLVAENPEFVEAGKRLKAWTDALVDYVAMSGNMDPATAQKIKDSYSLYVPFFRAIEGPRQHSQGRGVAERGTGLGRIKGSTYEIEDPLVALQQVARSMVAKAHQNQVMTALYKMALGQEAGGMATIVPRTSVPETHPLSRLVDAIEKGMKVPEEIQSEMGSIFDALRDFDAIDPQTITLFGQKTIPTGERNVIAYTPRLTMGEIDSLVAQGAHRQTLLDANNKLQWLEVDTRVYETLMGLDKMPMIPERVQPVLAVLRFPAVSTRLFATGINVSFAIFNAFRDMMSAPLFDPSGKFRPLGGFIDFVRGAAEYHKKGEIRELYEELGVRSASFWSEGRQRALIGEQQSMFSQTVRAIERVEELISTPENYIRMASFKDAYLKAKEEGKTEFEARMLALEAGKEITVNFARAGWLARSYNQFTPYFNAGIQGQRKLWGNLLMGGADSKSDAQRAAVQRATILNGIANITIPSMFFWWLHKDEEWYQDLPEWRKLGYINTKIGDQIVSIPKPFEAGIIFGGIPQIIGDRVAGKNPASAKEALTMLLGPYGQVGSLIPAVIKPILEVSTNKNFFTGRPLTPEWVARSSPPTEQATFYTTETAKILSRALGGILTPTEVEAVVGGYTAGSAVTAMQTIDEISGMKNHPGLAINPFNRMFKQREHGQSSFVDQLYQISVQLDQNEAGLNARDKAEKRRFDTAKKQISDLRKANRSGRMTQEEAERRSYEIARPLVERYQARNP